MHRKTVGTADRRRSSRSLAIAACSEKPEAGRACPLLCPQQADHASPTRRSMRRRVGHDGARAAADRARDLHDARVARRHARHARDRSLRYAAADATRRTRSTARSCTSTRRSSSMPIVMPDSLHKPTAPVTIEAYNVDTTATDTVAVDPGAAVSSRIGSSARRRSRRNRSRHAAHSDLHRLRARSREERHAASRRTSRRQLASAWICASARSQSATPVTLRLKRVARHGRRRAVIVQPDCRARRPDQTFLSGPLADFTIVRQGRSDDARTTMLAVGGVPSRRTSSCGSTFRRASSIRRRSSARRCC